MRKRSVGRIALTAAAVLLGVMALVPANPAGADGTEKLGPPNIPIAQGTDIVTDGTGMFTQPGHVSVTVPAGATVKQALVYWEGYNTFRNAPDNTIRVNGTEVAGTLIGGPTVFFGDQGGDITTTSWRADITSLDIVTPGVNNIALSGLAFDYANDGASIAVIYDDNTGLADIQVRDGNDNAFRDFAPPLDTTVPQSFTVAAAAFARSAGLTLMVGGVDANRPTVVRVTVGGVVTDHANLLGNSDGPQWDDFTIPVNVPANVTNVTVQILSEGQGGNGPASLTWVAAILAMAGPGGGGGPCSPPSTTIAKSNGSAYGADVDVVGVQLIDRLGRVSSVAPGAPNSQASQLLTANVSGLVSARVLGNTSNSALNPSRTTATSTIADVSLLGGLVKAATVRAVSQSVASPNSATWNSDGSTIQGLTVNGAAVNVAPNTSVNVNLGPLTVASLKIYEETGSSTFGNGVSKASHSVNMLRLTILSPAVGVVGTQITLAHAESAAESPVSGCPEARSVSGEAFTAYVGGDLGTLKVNEKVGDAVLPATGGNNSDGTNVNLPGIATSATAANSTSGSVDPNPHATARSIVEGANVLGGLVTASLLDVRSTSSADGTAAGTTFATTFVNLKVAGVAVAANVAPNSVFVVNLGAAGYVSIILNERYVNTDGKTDTEGTVNAIHARVYTLGGLLKGEVIVASAHSDAHV